MESRVAPRIHVGRYLRLVHEDEIGVEMAGPMRLRPGHRIRIDRGDGAGERDAVVWTWRLVRLGSDGTHYQGYCRWI